MEDKIKLEEELEFLKESLDAEVISKDEYEKAKARLEAQLSSIEVKEEKPINSEVQEEKTPEKVEEETSKEEVKTEEEKSEIKKEEPDKDEEISQQSTGIKSEKKAEEPEKEEEKIEIKEIDEPSKIKEIKKESATAKEPEKREIDEKEEDTNDILNSRNGFPEEGTEKKMSMWVPVVSGVLLLIIVYFSFLFLVNGGTGEKEIEEIIPACFSDDNCMKERMIGFCSSPGNQDAECEFKEDVQVNLLVLNTKDCFNCDISRVEKIINGWFPNIVKKEIDFNSEEGAALAKNLGIELLPAFIFNSSLEESFRYEDFRGIFSKVKGSYILSPSASGSTYYISRGEIPNKLEVFLMKDDSSTEKAEKNIEEFLELFDGSVDYKKHLVNKESILVKDLGINTFPTFLVNNKIRFSGVQPPEKIKDNFCKVNSLDECSSKLSENLV